MLCYSDHIPIGYVYVCDSRLFHTKPTCIYCMCQWLFYSMWRERDGLPILRHLSGEWQVVWPGQRLPELGWRNGLQYMYVNPIPDTTHTKQGGKFAVRNSGYALLRWCTCMFKSLSPSTLIAETVVYYKRTIEFGTLIIWYTCLMCFLTLYSMAKKQNFPMPDIWMNE